MLLTKNKKYDLTFDNPHQLGTDKLEKVYRFLIKQFLYGRDITDGKKTSILIDTSLGNKALYFENIGVYHMGENTSRSILGFGKFPISLDNEMPFYGAISSFHLKLENSRNVGNDIRKYFRELPLVSVGNKGYNVRIGEDLLEKEGISYQSLNKRNNFVPFPENHSLEIRLAQALFNGYKRGEFIHPSQMDPSLDKAS